MKYCGSKWINCLFMLKQTQNPFYKQYIHTHTILQRHISNFHCQKKFMYNSYYCIGFYLVYDIKIIIIVILYYSWYLENNIKELKESFFSLFIFRLLSIKNQFHPTSIQRFHFLRFYEKRFMSMQKVGGENRYIHIFSFMPSEL